MFFQAQKLPTNCEHRIKDALEKLEEVLDPKKMVEFEPDFDLTEH